MKTLRRILGGPARKVLNPARRVAAIKLKFNRKVEMGLAKRITEGNARIYKENLANNSLEATQKKMILSAAFAAKILGLRMVDEREFVRLIMQKQLREKQLEMVGRKAKEDISLEQIDEHLKRLFVEGVGFNRFYSVFKKSQAAYERRAKQLKD
jgi:hypothetical protein